MAEAPSLFSETKERGKTICTQRAEIHARNKQACGQTDFTVTNHRAKQKLCLKCA